MTNEEKLKKLHNALFRCGFCYSPMFTGEYMIVLQDNPFIYKENHDVFLLNSKKKKKVNLYKELQNKYYYNYIDKDLREKYKDILSPTYALSRYEGNDEQGFVTYPTYITIGSKYGVIFDEKAYKTFDDFFKKVKGKVQDTIYKVSDILEKYNKSIYFDDILSKMGVGEPEINIIKNKGKSLVLESQLKEKLSEMKSDLKLIDSLDIIGEKNVDFKELIECFDLDTFFLLYSKMTFQTVINNEYKEDELPPLLPQIYQYIHFIDELDLKNYNPRITFFKKDNKHNNRMFIYSLNDLKREVKNYLKNNKKIEFKYISINDPILDNEYEFESVKKAEKDAIKYRYGEDLSTIIKSWSFIGKGSIERKINDNSKFDFELSSNSKNSLNFSIMESEKRMEAFLKTDYICKIVGIDKFTGYEGFIYPNGVVAFEQFNDENGKPLLENSATYIMNIENFEHMSRLNKQEIINYIKTTDNPDVKRLYHSKNWEYKLIKICQNEYYSDEMKEKVDILINEIKAKQLLKENK